MTLHIDGDASLPESLSNRGAPEAADAPAPISRDLSGRVAIVTGAARGIGRAIADRLARAGAQVFINDLHASDAESAAEELHLAGSIAGDVADPATAAAAVKLAVDTCGGVDILVNNAGIMRNESLYRMTDSQWNSVLDASLRGAFNFMRAVAPPFRTRWKKTGRHTKIINITSTIGIYGQPDCANYSAAKAGLIGLTKSAARELARQRTNVNAIAPGRVAGTDLLNWNGENELKPLPTGFLDRLDASIPIGRAGDAQDIAALAHFLACPGSDYIVGQVIEAHGGLEITV